MRILYIYNLYQKQGGENLWFESEPDLFRAHGHDVSVYSRDNKEIEQMRAWEKAALAWQTTWSQRSYNDVRALIQSKRPQVVHVYNTLVQVSPSIYYACRDERVPIVQSIYNYRLVCPAATLVRNGKVCEECREHSLWRAVKYGCYRQSRVQSAVLAWMLAYHRWQGTWKELIDCYLVPSRFVKEKLIEGGIPSEKITIKPNWHEPDPRVAKNADDSILFVGQLSREKGIRTVLEAWKLIPDPPRLRIIGDGPLRKEVEHAVARNSQIEFLGRRSHDEVMAFVGRATALLVPSEWYEGFPHTILEAFASSVPVIAGRIGTLEDVIVDGVTGVLFSPGDAKDLARVLVAMLKRPEELQCIGNIGRREYETRYRGEQAYETLLNTYARISGSGL